MSKRLMDVDAVTEKTEVLVKTDEFYDRVCDIANEIELGMNCSIIVGIKGDRVYVQIECLRVDVITKVVGPGRGGKAWPSEFATDSEIVQMIFGLYKGYWEHEARENFVWRGRRPFGPHIDTQALWEVARRVDVRSQKHEEDKA